LSIHPSVAIKHLCLFTQLFNHSKGTVIPDVDCEINLVCLVDGTDCDCVIPQVLAKIGSFSNNANYKSEETTYIETLCPTPPNSPWNPIRLESNGVEASEENGVPHCGLDYSRILSTSQATSDATSTDVVVVIMIVSDTDIVITLADVVPARHCVDELMSRKDFLQLRNYTDLRPRWLLTPTL
jgi:hypothetical protein